MKMINSIMRLLGLQSGAKVIINGTEYSGRHVEIVVDGVRQKQQLIGLVSVVVHGNVDKVETASGDVSVLDVVSNVETMSGDVTCTGDIGGNVVTMSGDVRCVAIGGNVDTMSGSIIKN